MNFRDLIDLAKIQAIRDALCPTEDSVFKGLCRAYSQRFHVALPQVYLLDPEHVMREEFAAQLDDVNIEDNMDSILEQIRKLEDPNYEANEEKNLLEWIEDIEMDEEERIDKGLSVYKFHHPKEEKLEGDDEEAEKTPTGGSMSFSNLDGKNEQ